MNHPSELLDRVDEIVARWRDMLRVEPDPAPRMDARGVAERRLVQSLIRAGLSPKDDHVLHSLAVSAASYGMLEPLRRLDPDHVLNSLSCLREAIWGVLVENMLVEARDSTERWRLATGFILCVDEAMDLATRAAVVNSQVPAFA